MREGRSGTGVMLSCASAEHWPMSEEARESWRPHLGAVLKMSGGHMHPSVWTQLRGRWGHVEGYAEIEGEARARLAPLSSENSRAGLWRF